jgi:hypothetical protein
MNSPEVKSKQARSNPLYAIVLSMLFLPTGVSGQADTTSSSHTTPVISAERALDLSYLKDNLSDFIADRAEEKRDVFPDSVVAILFKRINRANSMSQKIRTFSQTLDAFLSLDKKDLGTPVFPRGYGRRNGRNILGAFRFLADADPERTQTVLAHDTSEISPDGVVQLPEQMTVFNSPPPSLTTFRPPDQ